VSCAGAGHQGLIRPVAAHVAAVTIPAHGHVNPMLALLEELVRRGHRVTCAATEEFVPSVAAAGASAVRYRSSLPTDPPLNPWDQDPLGRAPPRLLEEALGALAALEAALERDRPRLVIYDEMAWAGRMLARRWRVPAVQAWPTFASNERFSLGPRPVEVDPVEDLDLVFLPRAFQQAGETFDDRFLFVGPVVGSRASEGGWSPPADGRRVVLASLGTAWNAWPEFFRMCAEAFADPSWHLVMAIGQRVEPAALGPLPANAEAHRHVPQLAVLRHAAAFVTHGGMNSTMEALYHAVPLVVVPQMAEQEATARRVAELGLGRFLPREEVTPARLRDAVAELSRDPAVTARLRAMRDQIRAAGGVERAAGAIGAILERPPRAAPASRVRDGH